MNLKSDPVFRKLEKKVRRLEYRDPTGGNTRSVPDITSPALNLSLNSDHVMLPDAAAEVILEAAFQRGAITGADNAGEWEPNTLQAYRAGLPSSYSFPNTVLNTSALSAIQTFTTAVQFGINPLSVAVNYAAGPQPLDSSGSPYLEALPAGSITKAAQVVGTWPILGTFDNPDMETQHGLIDHTATDSIIITLQPDVGPESKTMRFLLPTDAFTLADVKYQNPFTGAFDITGTGDYSVSQVMRSIAGQQVPYTMYQNTGNYKASALQLQLNFQ